MTIKSKRTLKTIKTLEKISGGPLTLGRSLHSIRKCDKLTQQEFADKLNISKQYLCDLEKDRRYASPKAAAEYARKLKESETQFVRLCLQDLLNRDNIPMTVDVHPFKKRKYRGMKLTPT